MIRKHFKYWMQAVVMLCTSLVVVSCDDIFASEDNPIPTYLTMSDKPVTIKVNDTYKRTAIAVSDAVVVYSSSDTDVATVEQDGTVEGVADGTATITAKATGYSTHGRKIFIEDSKSYVVTVTGGGSSTGGGSAAPLSNNYRVYTTGTAYTDEPIPAGATVVESSAADVTWSAGTYVVEGNKTITGIITLTGDVNLILRDGAELTISGKIDGGTTESLNIYGQEASTGKLTIDGDGSIGSKNIHVKDLQIHGGDITGTNSGQALLSNGTLKIYHGTISTTARSHGIFSYDDLSIYGGTITASTTQSGAVAVNNADMEMTGGTLKATTTAQGEAGIVVHGGYIDISGGTVIAEGGTSTIADGGNGIHGMRDIKISGTANVTATGGDGAAVAGKHGGYGIYADGNQSIEISGGTVKAIGGGGSDGHAIKTGGATGNVSIKGGTVTATATGTNGNGIDSNAIDYYSGKAEATGAGSGRGINGTLTNKTSGSVHIKTKLTGGEADWTSSDIGPGSQIAPSTLTYRCIKINM